MTPTKTPEQRRSRAVFESKMTEALLSKNHWDDHWETWQEAEEFARADMLKNPPEEVIALAEPVRTWKMQVDSHGGDYLPGNYRQMIDALKAFDEARKG